METANAWEVDENVTLHFKTEEAPQEEMQNDFEKGEYQWTDEPETAFFKSPKKAKPPESDLTNSPKIELIAQKNEETSPETSRVEFSLKQMRNILQTKHKEELIRTRKALLNEGPKPKPKKKPQAGISEMSDKYLKKQISLNRDVLLYEKKWLFDREFKFFFSSVYYQNILATDLRWREDYQHVLFVRLMSYHNIGSVLF